MGANREFRNEYRATWNEFSRQMDELQRLVEARDNAGIECALLNVEKARLRHNAARDRLAVYLIGKNAESVVLQTARDEVRVRRTARLLWEFAGKPLGTAEHDWLRAERLVRSAAAGKDCAAVGV
jgi:hypothetical protein